LKRFHILFLSIFVAIGQLTHAQEMHDELDCLGINPNDFPLIAAERCTQTIDS